MKKCKKLLAIGVAASFLSLFACTKNEEKFKPAEGAEIVSLGIFESQMNRYHTYSFSIQEENNIVYFSGNYMTESGEEVDFQNCVVKKEEMEKARKIAKEINLIEYIKNYKKPKIQFSALDAPMYSTSVAMSDGSQKTTASLCDGSSELLTFFKKVAKKYIKTDSSKSAESE